MDWLKKYDYQSDEVIRTLRSELEQLTMEPGTDPDVFFLQAARCRAELQRMGEPITVMQGISSDYDHIKLAVYRNLTFQLDKIQATMRNVYRDDLSRRGKNSIGSRKLIMTVAKVNGHKGESNGGNRIGTAVREENS